MGRVINDPFYYDAKNTLEKVILGISMLMLDKMGNLISERKMMFSIGKIIFVIGKIMVGRQIFYNYLFILNYYLKMEINWNFLNII